VAKDCSEVPPLLVKMRKGVLLVRRFLMVLGVLLITLLPLTNTPSLSVTMHGYTFFTFFSALTGYTFFPI